jgi:hypothetical protein
MVSGAYLRQQAEILIGMSRGTFDLGVARRYAKHMGKKFLGQAECVVSNHVLGLQEPAAKPTTDRMEGVAGSILLPNYVPSTEASIR